LLIRRFSDLLIRRFADSLISYSHASASRTLTLVARNAGHRLASAESTTTTPSHSTRPSIE
jgi:hypothetical protein